MYKSKIGVWFIAIAAMVVVAILTHKINLPKKEIYTVYSNIADSSFANYVNKNSHFNIVNDMESADIIVLPRDDNREIDGYTKYASSLYSPVVMYMQVVEETKEKFVNLNVNDAIGKDYYSIIIAFEKGDTYENLGIDSTMLTGNIQLVIPNENVYYYQTVVDTFYYVLNGNKIPTSEEKDALESRVNNILSKCIKVDDIQSEIEKYHKDSKNGCNKIFIALENIRFRPSYTIFDSNNANNFDVVYNTTSSLALQYDVYISNKYSDVEKVYKNFASYGNNFAQNGSIPGITGYRLRNEEKYTYDSQSSAVLPIVSIAN